MDANVRSVFVLFCRRYFIIAARVNLVSAVLFVFLMVVTYVQVFIMFFICWSVAENAVAKEELRFLMPDYPPYTYQESGHNKGLGYEAVAAIMADLEQPFSVQLVPHFGRAIVELQQDTVDGFFLATESSERNKNAEFSEPVLMIQWT